MTGLIVCLLVASLVGLVCWAAAEGVAWLGHEQEAREQQEREWRHLRAGHERALREISALEYQTRQRLTEPVAASRHYDPNCRKCQQGRAAWQAQRDKRTGLG